MKRNEKTPIYLIVKPTGLFENDGIELVIVVDAKLTSGAADRAIEKFYPGCRKEKLFADKNET